MDLENTGCVRSSGPRPECQAAGPGGPDGPDHARDLADLTTLEDVDRFESHHNESSDTSGLSAEHHMAWTSALTRCAAGRSSIGWRLAVSLARTAPSRVEAGRDPLHRAVSTALHPPACNKMTSK